MPIPATNNFPIDTFAMEPYRIIPIPGGINGVIIAEVAVRTDENSFEYPAFPSPEQAFLLPLPHQPDCSLKVLPSR